jgi:type VI secretion system protein
MAGESLFERLRKARTDSVRISADDPQEKLRSAIRNLQNLFNAWAGHAPAQMDLGLPPPSEIAHGYPQSIPLVIKAIRTCIEKYEPRLTDVRVMHVESEEAVLQLRFKVDAKLVTGTHTEHVSFDTLVKPQGHVSLSG